jgi:sulfur-oxidizing protein SoxY
MTGTENLSRTRRRVLKAGGGAGAALLLAVAGWMRSQDALAADMDPGIFKVKDMQEAFGALNAGSRTASADISIVTPEIAENGASVPVGVESKVPGTQSIAILVPKNPLPLAAVFDIPEGTAPRVKTRVKMAETSDVLILVKAQGKFYVAKKEVKVTLGGCGG